MTNFQLLPYQIDAIEWCQSRESTCAILAYDMGLGKTIITCHLIMRKPLKTIILVPACVLKQWEDELQKHTLLNVMIYHGANRRSLMKNLNLADIVITTSQVFANDILHMNENPIVHQFLHSIKRLVIDEAHQLRNSKCKVYQVLYQFLPNIQNKIFLTGTPICNSVTDIISLICLSNYTPYNTLDKWRHMRHDKRLLLLGEIMENVLLRKTKSSTVSFALPKCNILNINLSLSTLGEQTQVYKSCMHDKIILRKILRMRQSLNNHIHLLDDDIDEDNDVAIKISTVNKLIREIPQTDKIIIFSYFTSLLSDLYDNIDVPNKFESIQLYHGEMNVCKRNQIISNFKSNDKARILLINLRAGGSGLNLVEANHVILMEPYWNDSEQEQAINRVHRMGQKKEVYIYKLNVENTIETWMCSLQKNKMSLFQLLIDNAKITIDELEQQKTDLQNIFKQITIES